MSYAIDLGGRRALVTGAGQGVGEAIAATLARAGAEVLVNDLVGERAESVVELIRAEGGTARAVPFDVTDGDMVAARFGKAGGVDILVNNAGNAGGDSWPGMVPFAMSRPSDWRPFLEVNLFGVMHCVHAALPSMIEKRWGRIITIISDAGRIGGANTAAYAAAKAGAAALTRSVAQEVGRHGITANNVSLGTMRTPLTEPRWVQVEDPAKDPQLQAYLVRRPGLPSDVAGLVTFLAGDGAEWITGQTYPVNGGYSFAL